MENDHDDKTKLSNKNYVKQGKQIFKLLHYTLRILLIFMPLKMLVSTLLNYYYTIGLFSLVSSTDILHLVKL